MTGSRSKFGLVSMLVILAGRTASGRILARVAGSFAMSVMLLGVFASFAGAAIYWGNGPPIARANLDGSRVDLSFIPFGPPGDGISSNAIPCGAVAVNASHIFWADPHRDTIGRANLDGSRPDYTFITGAQNPCGLALNASHVYWTNRTGNSIGRAKLDGTDQNQSFIGGVSNPCSVAVNDEFVFWASNVPSYIGRALIAGATKAPKIFEGDEDYALCGVAVNETHVFWGGFGDAIGRAGIDGSNPERAFITGVENPCGIAVNGSHLYWTELYTGNNLNEGGIGRAILDGTAMNRSVVTGLFIPCGIALDSVSLALPLPLRPESFCSIDELKVNRWRGVAFIHVVGPEHGDLYVRAKGLRWRVVSANPYFAGKWKWWLKIRPGGKSHAARRIRNQLRYKRKAPIRLSIECRKGESVASVVKRLVLRRVARPRRGK